MILMVAIGPPQGDVSVCQHILKARNKAVAKEVPRPVTKIAKLDDVEASLGVGAANHSLSVLKVCVKVARSQDHELPFVK
jgi:hypothetical protein